MSVMNQPINAWDGPILKLHDQRVLLDLSTCKSSFAPPTHKLAALLTAKTSIRSGMMDSVSLLVQPRDKGKGPLLGLVLNSI